ncbi:MAG: class I tRNA ligase family protein [Anaerolineales bacterium]|nr:class I tRNA ligase family protein [Anaerolineales bacterium]
MFKPVSTQVDFVKQEHEILDLWERIDAFAALKRLRAKAPRWSFIDGPITANNPMGVHHGWGRAYKDLFHRFKAMQGYQTRYQNGFDCQGLWVEVNVERELGFNSKREIEEFGLANFLTRCKQQVLKYSAVQTEQSMRLGYWMDWNDPDFLRDLYEKIGQDPSQEITVDGPLGEVTGSVEWVVGHLGMPELGGSYFTFSDENNYTIWSVIKSCEERGWVYKGRDVMPWCTRCGTGLSQHEIVTEGYQELTHPSITLRFPLIDKKGESLLVWTTTPWTLTSNVAAAVGPDLEYVKVRQGEEYFYLSEGTLKMLKGEYEVVERLKGTAMEGWRYAGPFDELPAQQDLGGPEAHRVILWDEVGQEEGTGIVHIAPGCGAEDFRLSKEHDLPVIAPLNGDGYFVEGFDWLTALNVKEVAEPIFKNLAEKGLRYKVEDYTHRYPVCWRCREELVFHLVDEWYISMGEQLDKPYSEVTEEEKVANLRYQMMEVVKEDTHWHPSFGLERELDWLRNMHDWMISKKRYYGLALPIWECDSCGNFDVIGSKEELRDRAVEGWEEFEGHSPHRPHIDAVKIACSNCGEVTSRIPDVGNPWLDAGVVAMSTLRYNSDRSYWEEWFPADLITESFPGQFRNWFYSLIAMSTILERRAPFRNVFTYATLLDEEGRAMHKSWGNMIEFNEAADKMGVDVMRWLYINHKPEKDLMFGYHRADEARRRFMIPLWNVYAFFVTYANIDGWKPVKGQQPDYAELDRWILARLNQLVSEVTRRLENFEPDRATETVEAFIDDLSNWYLRRSRRRFWAKAGLDEASDADKNAAYTTLYQVLVTLSRILAPFTPFVVETMHQNLVRTVDEGAPESVHHCEWPVPVKAWSDQNLIDEMALVQALVSMGHAARNAANRKLRQPLAEAAFRVPGSSQEATIRKYDELIRDELNVKKVRLLDTATEAIEYRLKALPKQLGQKYGAKYPAIRQAVDRLEPESAAEKLIAGETIEVDVEGETFTLEPDEVEVRVEAHRGFAAVAEGPYVAALDTELSEALVLEGLAREFVRRVQELRKQADFNVDDQIEVSYNASERLAEAIERHKDYIQGETIAVNLEASSSLAGEHRAEDTFEDEQLEFAVRRIPS